VDINGTQLRGSTHLALGEAAHKKTVVPTAGPSLLPGLHALLSLALTLRETQAQKVSPDLDQAERAGQPPKVFQEEVALSRPESKAGRVGEWAQLPR
jgi:hypothetical protein